MGYLPVLFFVANFWLDRIKLDSTSNDLRRPWRDDQCPVCLEDYHLNDWVTILPCTHYQHTLCLQEGLLIRLHFFCGECRAPMILPWIARAIEVERKLHDNTMLYYSMTSMPDTTSLRTRPPSDHVDLSYSIDGEESVFKAAEDLMKFWRNTIHGPWRPETTTLILNYTYDASDQDERPLHPKAARALAAANLALELILALASQTDAATGRMRMLHHASMIYEQLKYFTHCDRQEQIHIAHLFWDTVRSETIKAVMSQRYQLPQHNHCSFECCLWIAGATLVAERHPLSTERPLKKLYYLGRNLYAAMLRDF